jgi:hypothetical protein
MFHKVSTCQDGTVELWLYKCHQKEAREWAKVALGAIASLSGICLETERYKAESMFKEPDWVWEQLGKGLREDSLPKQCDAFMLFTPPSNASAQQSASRKKQNQSRNRPPRKEKLQLHFEMDLVKRTSLGQQQHPPMAADFPPLPTAGKKADEKRGDRCSKDYSIEVNRPTCSGIRSSVEDSPVGNEHRPGSDSKASAHST